MILPLFCCAITRPAACERKNSAFRSIWITLSQSSSLKSSAGVRRMIPALLIKMSSPPSSLTTLATVALRSATEAVDKSMLMLKKRRPSALT